MRSIAIVGGGTGAVAIGVAGVVLVGDLGTAARGFLRFDFAGTQQGGLQIATHNARLAAAAFIGALAWPHLGRVRFAVDACVIAVYALNAALIGVAIGAYGEQTLRVLALHGPLELAALSVAGGTYLTARRGLVTRLALCRAAASSAALLIVAGVIETSVQIGGLR